MTARTAVAAAAAALVIAFATTARAMGVCDPDGHFCMVVDATSARVCDVARPGKLDPATCDAGDESLRALTRRAELAERGAVRMIAGLVIRFGDWRVLVCVTRRDAEPEIADDAGVAAFAHAAMDAANARARPSGWLLEPSAPPALGRLHGVQVARLELRGESAGVDGVVRFSDILYEVRAETAVYDVSFSAREPLEGGDPARLPAFAESTMATLDAIPMRRASAADAVTWIVRLALAGGGLAVLGLVGGRVLRRRRGGLTARDLWPM
jgi:hypothetical protein